MRESPTQVLKGILKEEFKPENVVKFGGHESGSTAYADLIATDRNPLPDINEPFWQQLKDEFEHRYGQKVKKFNVKENRILSHAKDGISIWIVV